MGRVQPTRTGLELIDGSQKEKQLYKPLFLIGKLRKEVRILLSLILNGLIFKRFPDSDEDIKGFVVWAGLEPLEFKALFPDWVDKEDIKEINMQVGI